MNKDEKKYCVYFHINPLKNHVFYVGIGDVNRPYEKIKRSTHWQRVVKKYGYTINIVEQKLTWSEACEREKFYIKKIGRIDFGNGPLVNKTDGGDGLVGVVRTKEWYEKVSKSLTGKNLSPEHIAIIKANRANQIIPKGQKRSEQARNNMREAAKKRIGVALKSSTKRKLSLINKGRIITWGDKISQSKIGHSVPAETRLKISLAGKNKKLNIADKKRISNAFRKKREAKDREYVIKRIPWNKGKKGYKAKPCSEERKRKISEAQMGEKNHQWGKKASMKTRNKMSLARMGKPATSGSFTKEYWARIRQEKLMMIF